MNFLLRAKLERSVGTSATPNAVVLALKNAENIDDKGINHNLRREKKCDPPATNCASLIDVVTLGRGKPTT